MALSSAGYAPYMNGSKRVPGSQAVGIHWTSMMNNYQLTLWSHIPQIVLVSYTSVSNQQMNMYTYIYTYTHTSVCISVSLYWKSLSGVPAPFRCSDEELGRSSG